MNILKELMLRAASYGGVSERQASYVYEELMGHTRPWSIYEFRYFLIFLLVESGILLILMLKEKINLIQFLAIVLESIMIALVYGTTVFTRVSQGVKMYNLMPGWSWIQIMENADKKLLLEDLLNIVMFFPLGVVMPFAFFKRTKYRWGIVLGFLFSAFIETSQLVTCRGLFEWDDMIHNTLGCVLGLVIGNLLFLILRPLMKRIR